MNLLTALYKERSTMSDKVHNIRLYLQKKSDVISKTPYTEQDLSEAEDRLEEFDVAIKAILNHRKTKTTPNEHTTK